MSSLSFGLNVNCHFEAVPEFDVVYNPQLSVEEEGGLHVNLWVSSLKQAEYN
jgi:hypothetical protein